ncbi:MAG: penicillin-binding transpeptidase domain-containing protein [Anaerolineae bacterium]|nr:penicillin-binding transpeptidase domain-containing protein [Anaerolineae bacterium]
MFPTPLSNLKPFLTLLLLLFVVYPLSAQPADGPRAIVSAFLTAWDSQDSALMYSYLSPMSQAEFPQEVFENRYTVANNAINLTGVRYTIQSIRLQGESAEVIYDVVITSSSFGEIADPGRMMRLIRLNGAWGIAWSSMDIFNSLAGASTISSDGQLFPRANIYDRNGNLIAGLGRITYLYTTRLGMSDEIGCQNLIATLTRRSRQYYAGLFNRQAPETIFFLAELEESVFNRHREDLSVLCGVNNESLYGTYETRVYYGNNAMTHITGYIGQIQQTQIDQYRALGYSTGDLVGQNGIELMHERSLAGTPRRVLRISEPGGTVLRELGGSSGIEPVPVQLTIDRDLQVAVAQALFDGWEYAAGNWSAGAAGAGVAVLDVNTGEILALASYPLVDPLLFNPDSANPERGVLVGQLVNDPRQPLANHAVQNQYFPGSTYKVITAAAVLNEGLTRPVSIFNCELFWDGGSFGDTAGRRPDWRVADELPAAGEITPAQALMSSCNPFFWRWGAELYNTVDRDSLADYSRQMGLGQAYNIFGGAVTEVAGSLAIPANVTAAVNEAVGQGDVQLPPIQMAVATAAIANDGTVYRPYLVMRVGGLDGTPLQQENSATILQELDFGPEVLATIREGMCGAVTDQGLGTAFRVFNEQDTTPTYTACGKTGTAQTENRANAWFIAYAPAENPQIAIVVAVPSAGREGSEVAAPITRRILDYYFNSPIASYPEWWATEPYRPLVNPNGMTTGG